MPSDSRAEAPRLRLSLPDCRPATLLLGRASTVLSVDDALVSSWDLAGRPYALVRESGTYRRGLDGRLLWKREATAAAARVRRRLSAEEGEPIVEAARREAEQALAALSSRGASVCPAPSDASVHRLATIVAMDAAALRVDAARFLATTGPVGILPPDQYLGRGEYRRGDGQRRVLRLHQPYHHRAELVHRLASHRQGEPDCAERGQVEQLLHRRRQHPRHQ